MTEPVGIVDRVKTAISLGETHFREFKSALDGRPGEKVGRKTKDIAKDIAEGLVAFANADGGELLVGVEDDATVSGIEHLSEANIKILEDAPKTHVHGDTPLPAPSVSRAHVDGHTILYFFVLKSTRYVHLTADGRCLQRHDLETRPISSERIQSDRQEIVSREYDRQYVTRARSDHLDQDLVRITADEISPGISSEKCLQYLNLAEYTPQGLQLKRAALLLFARDITEWHPRSQIRIMKVEGQQVNTGDKYNVSHDQVIRGNILTLLRDGWEALRPQLVQESLTPSGRFETTVMYPEHACREALVNALAHRDYSQEGKGIEIFVFQDRMEVVSPGGLISGVSLHDIQEGTGIHQSRNSFVARVLRELGYMRELGEGIRRIFELMKSWELEKPEFDASSESFKIVLHHKPVYNEKQRLWLDQFSDVSLNQEEKAIVVLGQNGSLLSPNDIWYQLGIVDTEHYRQLIASLQEKGILQSEVSRSAAQSRARAKRIATRDVPRFRITPQNSRKPSREKAQGEGRPVDEKSKQKGGNNKPSDRGRVFVGNIPKGTSNNDLYEFFSKYGEVSDIYNRSNKGFAFVEFQNPDVGDDIIEEPPNALFLGHKIVLRSATPAPERRPKAKN